MHTNMAEYVKESEFSVSATDLAARISNKDDVLTSVNLVRQCIEQIRRTNVYLNAVVCDRFELALLEATEADAAVAEDRVPPNRPFWGVP